MVSALDRQCDEAISVATRISGLPCVVNAYLRNGLVEGSLACHISNLHYKFDMAPTLSKDRFQNVCLHGELRRLYLDLKMNDYRAYQLRLKVRMVDSVEEIKQNFLLSIKGSINPYNSVILEPIDTLNVIQVTI